MKDRHSVIPAVYLVFRKNNQVLLLRRSNTGFGDGKLSLPAGHVDPGETFRQTAAREAQEEVGAVIDPSSLKPLHMMHRNKPDGQERVDMFFMVDQWQGSITNKEPHKCSELIWSDIHRLPDDLLDYVRSAVNDGLLGTFYSEYW